MIKLKAFIAVCCVCLLSACAETPLLAPEVASNISVQDITVDTSNFSGVSGRSIDVPTSQVRTDIERAVRARMQGQGARGGQSVSVNVAVDRVALVSPGQSLLIGGVSSITARVSITDLATGASILPETVVTSSSEGYAPGGILGATSRGTPQADYAQTVASFANNVAIRILGKQSTTGGAVSAVPASPSGGGNANRESAWQL